MCKFWFEHTPSCFSWHPFPQEGTSPSIFLSRRDQNTKNGKKSCSIFHLVRSPPAFFFRLEVCVPFAPSIRSFRSRNLKKRNGPRFLTCGYDRKFQNREKHWGKMNGGKKAAAQPGLTIWKFSAKFPVARERAKWIHFRDKKLFGNRTASSKGREGGFSPCFVGQCLD